MNFALTEDQERICEAVRRICRRFDDQYWYDRDHDGEFPEDFDWGALSDRRATTAVYMGNRTLPALSKRLLEEGIAHDTPAFLIERASTPEQRVIRGTIADLTGKVAKEEIVGPVMVLIGWALTPEGGG